MTKADKILYGVLGEGGLILVVCAIGWLAHMPLIFSSLGPTAYELVEKPNTPSARTYNIVVGHFFALAAGYFALWVMGAWDAPKVASAGFVASPRLWAAVLSVVVTTGGTLLLKASQPAALSTTLLISLGSMQRGRDAVTIMLAVIILVAVGEPLRRKLADASAG